MKNIGLLLLFFLAVNITSAQKINWVTFEEALELQKKEPRKIMVDMYTVWCGPCKMLDKNTFQNKDVVKYVNKHYYAVKFNAQGNDEVNYKGRLFTNPNYNPALANRRNSPHQLASYFKVQAYPTIVFLDENAEFLTPVRGYKKPQDLELYLKLFKNDDHKDMKTQEAFNNYYKAFKPEFQQ
ncbi:thioredoxin family protein [Pontimicrobium sp. IMCC45349]|jgi:thioredoxin-related protein|uniref:thioredoxin family protein n=1 Tax=Pontimicrobium sp. IMCC45349 TaxID=3391574 RepID=UPI0039A1CDE8